MPMHSLLKSKTRSLTLVSMLALTPTAYGNEVTDILNSVDDMWRGKSSSAMTRMTVKTKRHTRVMRMKYWSLGKDFFLARIESPKKERGTMTLKRGNDIYNYLPKIDRTIKIGAAMMGGSWMGSHMSNDDLVKSSSMAEDYHAKITGRKKEGKGEVIDIELIPKEDSAVVWGKVTLAVKMPGFIPLSENFYDEDLKKLREMTFSNVKKVGSRMLPMTTKVIPLDKPGEYTEMVTEELEFDVNINKSFFSKARLKK